LRYGFHIRREMGTRASPYDVTDYIPTGGKKEIRNPLGNKPDTLTLRTIQGPPADPTSIVLVFTGQEGLISLTKEQPSVTRPVPGRTVSRGQRTPERRRVIRRESQQGKGRAQSHPHQPFARPDEGQRIGADRHADGRAFFMGATGQTNFYTPSGTTAPGVWSGPALAMGRVLKPTLITTN
jgi:hypothetical protein